MCMKGVISVSVRFSAAAQRGPGRCGGHAPDYTPSTAPSSPAPRLSIWGGGFTDSAPVSDNPRLPPSCFPAVSYIYSGWEGELRRHPTSFIFPYFKRFPGKIVDHLSMQIVYLQILQGNQLLQRSISLNIQAPLLFLKHEAFSISYAHVEINTF